jgi:hypothetical protein
VVSTVSWRARLNEQEERPVAPTITATKLNPVNHFMLFLNVVNSANYKLAMCRCIALSAVTAVRRRKHIRDGKLHAPQAKFFFARPSIRS